MLQRLTIHNIALIDSAEIEFDAGLNILTGETGAGKSIIIDSINVILGDRLSKELIRSGKEKATVEALFLLDDDRLASKFEELGIEPEEDGSLLISREFTINGKNNCRINGKMVTVSMLKEMGEQLIDIHGQHDNQSLLRTEKHIELLDSFGGKELHKLKQEYEQLLSQYKIIKSRLKSLTGDKNERERKIDILKYQIDEIKKARLKTGEEEELVKQRTIQASAEKIIDALSLSYERLYGGNESGRSALDSIHDAVRSLDSIARLNEKFDELSKKVQEVSYQLEDVLDDIRRERDGMEFSPVLLDQLEERLDLIFKLKKKYGTSINEILEYCKRIENELDEILKSEETAAGMENELASLREKLFTKAAELHAEREKSAGILEKNIGIELEDLEMKRARFKTAIDFDNSVDEQGERKFTQNGLDRVEFMISANAGEPLKPLSKIASGGEMSRVMLAIKNILATVDQVPVLIFDEIDIGISGKAAQKVGEKLSSISRRHQVICVTHLAQIGSMADNHYLIEKIEDADTTQTRVKKLAGREVVEEIARIIGGTSISGITLSHAEEMLKDAKSLKEKPQTA